VHTSARWLQHRPVTGALNQTASMLTPVVVRDYQAHDAVAQRSALCCRRCPNSRLWSDWLLGSLAAKQPPTSDGGVNTLSFRY
jgi:hypothetical protein